MRLLARDRLTSRLVVTVGVGLLLFSIVAGLLTYQYSYRHELERAESLQTQLVRTVKDQAEVAAFAANRQIAQGVLDGLLANPFILAASIESKEGLAVGAGKRMDGATRRDYPLFSPVDHVEPIGMLLVLQDDAYVHGEAARAAAYQTALLLAQVLFAVLSMAAVLRIMMIVPITRLANAMGAIRPGSSARLTIDDKHARDEIGLLSKSANALLQASQAAIKEERALSSLLESTGSIAHVGGWQFDPQSKRLTWSAELYRIHERDPVPPIEIDAALSYFNEPDRSRIVQASRRAVLHGEPFDLELPLTTATGRQAWVRIQGQYKSNNAERRLLYGALQDVTARKKAEADLIAAKQVAEAANRAKSQFLAAASHDLRQPIQAINLFHGALARSGLTAEQERICNYLALSTQSLSDLLNALLDISKLDGGSVKPNPEVLPVETLFGHIDAEFSSLAMAKSLRFRLYFPCGDMAVLTDPDLLQSLLGNLIGNAIKYTERGGILVAIRRRGSQALIQVWDTGVGIAAQDIERIFNEYFQVGNPERNRAKGLGLGLSIARRLARLLGSDIVCRSRPGGGSVFEFRLPLTEPSQGDPAVAAAPATRGTGQSVNRHVVVVEDDEVVAEALVLALEATGAQVTTYRTAEDALADAGIDDACCYITDFRLPGMDGVQFLDAVQRQSDAPIRAVVLTGDSSPDRIEMARSSRWTILFKPIDLPSLMAAIEAPTAAP